MYIIAYDILFGQVVYSPVEDGFNLSDVTLFISDVCVCVCVCGRKLIALIMLWHTRLAFVILTVHFPSSNYRKFVNEVLHHKKNTHNQTVKVSEEIKRNVPLRQNW